MNATQIISSPRHAATLLAHPLRPRILARARQPISAADLARLLDQPRQRVNYHVRQLAAAGFLESLDQQKKRNMMEQQYVASAAAYILSPAVLGEVAPVLQENGDSADAGGLVAMCSRAQTEVAAVMEAATAAGVRVRTLSLETELHFAAADERAEFMREVKQAVSDVVSRYSTSERGGSVRLILGCYPARGTR